MDEHRSRREHSRSSGVKVAGHRRARQLTSASDSRSSPQLTESAVGLVLPWPQPLAYKAWLVGHAGKSSLRQLSLGRAMALVNLLLSSQKLKPRQSECPDLTSVPQGHSVLGKRQGRLVPYHMSEAGHRSFGQRWKLDRRARTLRSRKIADAICRRVFVRVKSLVETAQLSAFVDMHVVLQLATAHPTEVCFRLWEDLISHFG